MKNYTDIEQSKKLAEILPLESADGLFWGYHNKWYSEGDELKEDKSDVPCWSIESLINVLPESIEDNENGLTAYMSMYKYDSLWVCAYDYENKEDGNCIAFAEKSFIDAVFEMILKLHEQKLL